MRQGGKKRKTHMLAFNQTTKNRLSQMAFSVLVQLSRNKELVPHLTTKTKKLRPALNQIPEHIVENNTIVIPDRPSSAISTQDMSLEKLAQFFANKDGRQYLPQKRNGKLSLLPSKKPEIHPNKTLIAQKENARKALTFVAEEIVAKNKQVLTTYKYYVAAKQTYQDILSDENAIDPISHRKNCKKAFTALAREGATLAKRLDELTLRYLFFYRNRNEVAASGFRVSAFDDAVKSLADIPLCGVTMQEPTNEELTPKTAPTN